MQHSDNKDREGQGENFFAVMPQASFEAAAKVWIDEESKYHGQPIDQSFSQYGHWTQVCGIFVTVFFVLWEGKREIRTWIQD